MREGVSAPTVGKWRARFVELRLEGWATTRRGGHPRSPPISRGRRGGHLGVHAGERDALVTGEDGPAQRPVQIQHRAHLAGVRAQAAPGRHVQAQQRPAVRREGLRRRRAVHEPAGGCGGAVRGREEPGSGAGPSRGVPDDARDAGETHPRLCAPRHDQPVRGFNTADGTVISSMHRRHRTIEFKNPEQDRCAGARQANAHLVCDNYGTHKSPAIKKGPAAHPRFHVHYTPTYSSWINQAERWFAYLTDDLLRRSDHRTVKAPKRHPRLGRGPEPGPETLRLDQNRRADPQLPRQLLKRISGEGH